MPRSTPAIVTTVALLLLSAACGSGEPSTGSGPGEESDGALDGTVDGTDADEPVDGGTSDGVDLDAATETAVADLAASEDVDPERIEVVTAEEVTWADGALGCPEPDRLYTQALVPGYRVVLAVDGEEVHYHGAVGDTATRCDDPEPPAETDGA